MTTKQFITSRQGQIKSIALYEYEFSNKLNEEQKVKLCSWLKHNPDILLHKLDQSSFSTYLPLNKRETWQYKHTKINVSKPPFENPSLISSYLAQQLRQLYAQKFKQFLNRNTYIVNTIDLKPFHLLKCFDFNIEVFKDGIFFIHFLPVSKIVSESTVDHSYLLSLKSRNRNNAHTDSMILSLIDCHSSFRKRKFDLLDKQFVEDTKVFLEDKERVIASFDYHFMANYSPDIFGKIENTTKKELTQSIEFLIPVSEMIQFPATIELHNKPFYEIEIEQTRKKYNLLIGNGKVVREQKAAYYDGVYQPVSEKVIQPIVVNNENSDYKIPAFYDLVARFNKEGDVQIFDAIWLSSDDNIDESVLKDLKRKYDRKLLFAVFTKYQQTKEFFDPIRKSKLRYQIYKGEIEKFQLSNFTIKCLEKLGGFLNVINDSFEPETTYFLGVDLGHTTQNDKQYSNLCLALFNHRGKAIAHRVIEEMPRNEALNEKAFFQATNALIQIVKKRDQPYPKKVIVHRDGRLHSQDIACFEKVFREKFEINDYDVVEIIKSGYPVMAAHDGKEYVSLESGSFWILHERQYAILVTNTQVTSGRGGVLNPIVIKHKHGNTEFVKLVEQVYWFTKMYTNNLFNSTRLPATTEKANNRVGTGDKRFVSTYLG